MYYTLIDKSVSEKYIDIIKLNYPNYIIGDYKKIKDEYCLNIFILIKIDKNNINIDNILLNSFTHIDTKIKFNEGILEKLYHFQKYVSEYTLFLKNFNKNNIFDKNTNQYTLFGKQLDFDISNSFPLFDFDLNYVFEKIMELKFDYLKNNIFDIFKLDLSFNKNLESFYIFEIDGYLYGNVYSKKCNIFTRLPISISIYSLFLYMIANIYDLKVKSLVYSIGISYTNNLNDNFFMKPFPKLIINKKINSFDDFNIKNFELSQFT